MFLILLISSFFTFVELNCENLFDTHRDSVKQDAEFQPAAIRRWTKKRYWRKLDNIAQEILSTCDDKIPDMIALCEVENDTVLYDLTNRSLLRGANYDYIMTSSPDLRGINVALLFSPYSFMPVHSRSIRVEPVKGMRPTRDILYVSGINVIGDTLHVFVVHAPSRYGGERYTRPFRLAVADRLCEAIDSVQSTNPDAQILIAGDFNDEFDSPVMNRIYQHHLLNLTKEARGLNGVRGTYRYQGKWSSIDHILSSPSLHEKLDTAYIHAPMFLLEDEPAYGGFRPRRTYNGVKYQGGYSDHLPLVARFRF